jgi:hypothetical protein
MNMESHLLATVMESALFRAHIKKNLADSASLGKHLNRDKSQLPSGILGEKRTLKARLRENE